MCPWKIEKWDRPRVSKNNATIHTNPYLNIMKHTHLSFFFCCSKLFNWFLILIICSLRGKECISVSLCEAPGNPEVLSIVWIIDLTAREVESTVLGVLNGEKSLWGAGSRWSGFKRKWSGVRSWICSSVWMDLNWTWWVGGKRDICSWGRGIFSRRFTCRLVSLFKSRGGMCVVKYGGCFGEFSCCDGGSGNWTGWGSGGTSSLLSIVSPWTSLDDRGSPPSG